MSPVKLQSLLIILLLFFLAACTNTPAPDDVFGTEIKPQVTEEPHPLIDVCEPLDTPGVAFPRQEYVEGPREMMAAELVGDLVLRDGCLHIKSLYGDTSYLPLWPAEFTVSLDDDGFPVVMNGQQEIVGRVGEEIYMGGGEASANAMLACVREQLPNECGGKVWVVGDGTQLNLNFDSELFSMDMIPAPDRTAILLKKEPILDEWAGEPDSITGILRFYFPDRCPRIKSESGARDFLPVWPSGYSLQITDDLVEILDGEGNLVARQDEKVTLNGALVPPDWNNPNYRQHKQYK